MSDEMFESASRTKFDLAGVFEYDGETGYFYLYATPEGGANKVLDSIRIITSGEPDFVEDDVSVRWDTTEEKVGLFVRGVLWAVFDCGLRAKFGGDYRPRAAPTLSGEVASGFEPRH